MSVQDGYHEKENKAKALNSFHFAYEFVLKTITRTNSLELTSIQGR
jgi:hypothetical protein